MLLFLNYYKCKKMANTVSSEIYAEANYISTKKANTDGNVVSIFKFIMPTPPKLDTDGDFDLQRTIKSKDNVYTEIEIEHSVSTSLNLVGLQIWRGALLLADWLIYNSKNFLSDEKILELGSGVGLTSIVASMFRPVLCTDIDEGGILNLLQSNINRNNFLVKYPVTVLELNFFLEEFSPDLANILPEVKVVLAADVIYDNDITSAFVRTIERLLAISPNCCVYVALEKRYVFVLSDCDTCAPCYEYFLECLDEYSNIHAEEVFIDFPQYFLYDRVKELVMWKICLKN